MKTGFSGVELDAPKVGEDKKKLVIKAYVLYSCIVTRSGTGFVFSFLLVKYRTTKNAK